MITYHTEKEVRELLNVSITDALASGELPPHEAQTIHGTRLWSVKTITKILGDRDD